MWRWGNGIQGVVVVYCWFVCFVVVLCTLGKQAPYLLNGSSSLCPGGSYVKNKLLFLSSFEVAKS